MYIRIYRQVQVGRKTWTWTLDWTVDWIMDWILDLQFKIYCYYCSSQKFSNEVAF